MKPEARSDDEPAGSIVFVVDDDDAMRESLRTPHSLRGIERRAFSSARAFLRQEVPEVPTCLVLDVRMPGLSGLDLQNDLADARRQIPIIFITDHGSIPMTVRAMKAGALEFLPKSFSDQELLDAIEQSLELDREALAQRKRSAGLHARYQSLTPREREVMRLVVKGLLNKQVAGNSARAK